MADIGKVSAELQHLYDPTLSDSLQHQIGAAAAQAIILRNRTTELLDGSENPDAHALRREIQAITTGLAELVTRTENARGLQENLITSWTGGRSPDVTAPDKAADTPAAAQHSPSPRPTPEQPGTARPNILKPGVNYRNPAIQAQLDRPLSEVFSPHAVGGDASKALLAFFQKRGQVMVRDLVASGGDLIAYGTFAQRYRDTLRQKMREACPQVPMAKHFSIEDIARISPDLSQVPIQVLFSGHTNAMRRRVSIADLVDADGKANGYAYTTLRLNRPENLHILRKIESFVRDYNQAVKARQWE